MPLPVPSGNVLSAVLLFQFLRGAAFHAPRRIWVFTADLRQGRTCRFLLMQFGERLAEPQQRIRRLAAVLVLGRHSEEGFRRLAVLLLPEQRVAKPELRVGRKPLLRGFAPEIADGPQGKIVIFVQHVAVSEIVLILRARRGRQRRKLTGAGSIARGRSRNAGLRGCKRVRLRRLCGRIVRQRREIERRAGHRRARRRRLGPPRTRWARPTPPAVSA